ncbi:hypothetical protein GDI3278 [Gluconacetobacter diazotrophicus PA1 5]|uniref:Uncharacterized protein n=1 Tax=Gluconacetobacter diazotrophicus (strain ATCC 49037 / DSM 5601 / CCUG 37298 / CIP 103539 / LMG 7603 / PAl5) TaxID=272568 RepID=A9H184_GLUDA|nr:hypothetical protein GDI3278 [Gluconacetobacter diazotrophicus PA1 5]
MPSPLCRCAVRQVRPVSCTGPKGGKHHPSGMNVFTYPIDRPARNPGDRGRGMRQWASGRA